MEAMDIGYRAGNSNDGRETKWGAVIVGPVLSTHTRLLPRH